MIDFKIKGKIVIGLTGSIASGKSTASRIFAALGAQVICADELSHQFFDEHKAEIQQHFGTSLRGEIAAKIFNDPAAKKWLQDFLHPLILARAKELAQSSKSKVIVFDVPLLFEAGLSNAFDKVVTVSAPQQVRLQRALSKGLSRGDFEQRDLSQISAQQKEAQADVVFNNNATQQDLEAQIKNFYYGLTK